MKLELPKKLSLGKRPTLGRPGKLQTPQVATDLAHDLRARRLLPLVALLLVAIVAAPLLLSNPAPELSPTTGQSGLAVSSGSGGAALTVVAQTPVGLRDYRTRLKRLKAKNPFHRHFTAPQVAGADLGTSSTTTTVPTVTTTVTSADLPSTPSSVPSVTTTVTGGDGGSSAITGSGDHGGGGGNGNSNGSGPSQAPVETQVASYRIDASVGAPGKMKVRQDVAPLTMLPNPKNPVAVFMGVTPDSKRALFLVSSDVTSVFGDARCGFGDSSCQLIEIEPGFPVTFTYGADDKRFRIAVQKISRTVDAKRVPSGSGHRPTSVSLGSRQSP